MGYNDSILEDGRLLYEFLSRSDDVAAADLILVCGSHDLRVAEHAAKLYLACYAPLILCSGGYGKGTEGVWSKPEGLAFAERCMALGVPRDAIVIEDQAGNTGENFTLSHVLLDGKGITPETGIIVSKPYMAKRAWATGSKQWDTVKWFVNPPEISFDEYPSDETPLDQMIHLMVGDLQRMRVYVEKGYQVPVDVPQTIWSAYARLLAEGYTHFVIN